MEQREPVFGLWLELPGTLFPQRITANLLRPLLSPSLSLSLSSSSSLFHSSHPLLGSSRRYISHSIFSHGSSSSSYTCLDIPPSPLPRSLILDVVQVASKRTTGSSRRGSFLSLRLFAHLLFSAFLVLPLYRSPSSFPISSSIFSFSPEADLTFSLEHSPL